MAKINPNFSNFFTNATAAGFGSNEIISFMQDMFSNPYATAEKSRLQEGTRSGSLRPDELEAAQISKRNEAPERIAKGAAKAAGTIGGIGLAAGKLPGAIQAGLGALSALGGKGKSEPSQSEQGQERPGGFQSFLSQHPELGKFLDDLIIGKKVSPMQAAAEAKKKRSFQPIIAQVEDDVGQSFEDLLKQFFQGSESEERQQVAPRDDKISPLLQALRELKELRTQK
jgi:hypothetical protein